MLPASSIRWLNDAKESARHHGSVAEDTATPSGRSIYAEGEEGEAREKEASLGGRAVLGDAFED
jgi:hypothetical protein